LRAGRRRSPWSGRKTCPRPETVEALANLNKITIVVLTILATVLIGQGLDLFG
jgi:hypothetical protein